MSIRIGTVFYENYEGHDLNYYKHNNTYCVYIGDILKILGQVTARGNYAGVAYKHLEVNNDYVEFRMTPQSWNRVYLTQTGITKLYNHFSEQEGGELIKCRLGVIEHCNDTLNSLVEGKTPEIKEQPSVKPRLKKPSTEDSYVVDLLEDIDARLSRLESDMTEMVRTQNFALLFAYQQDINLTRQINGMESVMTGTLQCLLDAQLQSPFTKDKGLKERLKHGKTALANNMKLLDKNEKAIEEREKHIEKLRQKNGWKTKGDYAYYEENESEEKSS